MPKGIYTRPTAEERFWAKVDKTGECWLWAAGKHSAGYGWFNYEGQPQLAHRIAYELTGGEIPKGLTLDHLCRVRHCVNPDHLEPVTNKENILRGESPSAIHARKTHCPQGHPYSGENLYMQPNGSRRCRTCQSEAYKSRKLKQETT